MWLTIVGNQRMTEIGLCTHPKNTLRGRKYRVQRRLGNNLILIGPWTCLKKNFSTSLSTKFWETGSRANDTQQVFSFLPNSDPIQYMVGNILIGPEHEQSKTSLCRSRLKFQVLIHRFKVQWHITCSYCVAEFMHMIKNIFHLFPCTAKLVPIAYGIKKLQIGAVLEDEKVRRTGGNVIK